MKFIFCYYIFRNVLFQVLFSSLSFIILSIVYFTTVYLVRALNNVVVCDLAVRGFIKRSDQA